MKRRAKKLGVGGLYILGLGFEDAGYESQWLVPYSSYCVLVKLAVTANRFAVCLVVFDRPRG